MLFISSSSLLKIQPVIAWLILLFQGVIFFAEDSGHQKQSRKGARMGALSYWQDPAGAVMVLHKP